MFTLYSRALICNTINVENILAIYIIQVGDLWYVSLVEVLQVHTLFFFKCFWWPYLGATDTSLFLDFWQRLLWVQRQSGFCLICIVGVNVIYPRDPPLTLHLLTSKPWPVPWQASVPTDWAIRASNVCYRLFWHKYVQDLQRLSPWIVNWVWFSVSKIKSI